MHFANISLLASLATAFQGDVTAQQVISNLDTITDLSTQAQAVAQSISPANIVDTASQLVNILEGLTTLVAESATSAIPKVKREDPLSNFVGGGATKRSRARQVDAVFSDIDQQVVCSSFDGFASQSQTMLGVVTGKLGLLSATSFATPIQSALKGFERTINPLTTEVVPSVPSCAQVITQSSNTLLSVLGDALNTLAGIISGILPIGGLPVGGLPPVSVPSASLPTTLPPVSVPSVGVPPVSVPTAGLPTTGLATVTVPSVSVPSPSIPSVGVPTVPVPPVSVPSVSVPSVGVPPVPVPTVVAPTVSVPTVSAPSVGVPGATVPGVRVPSVSVPGVGVPGISIPSIPLPSIGIPLQRL